MIYFRGCDFTDSFCHADDVFWISMGKVVSNNEVPNM